MPKINPYKMALDIQDASNLAGVVRTLHVQLIPAVREELEEKLGRRPGTSEINQHPAVKLFSDKLYDLSRARYDENFKAFDVCYEHANL